MTTFKVYRKYENRLRLVDSIEIRIDENREPDVRLGTKTGGMISKAEVLALGGIIARRYVNDGHVDIAASDRRKNPLVAKPMEFRIE